MDQITEVINWWDTIQLGLLAVVPRLGEAQMTSAEQKPLISKVASLSGKGLAFNQDAIYKYHESNLLLNDEYPDISYVVYAPIADGVGKTIRRAVIPNTRLDGQGAVVLTSSMKKSSSKEESYMNRLASQEAFQGHRDLVTDVTNWLLTTEGFLQPAAQQ